VDATGINLTFDPNGEVISGFARKEDFLMLKNTGILLKAKKVVFE